MAHLLGAEALHLEYPTRIVFDSVTLGIGEGDRIGILGVNGSGKSTLLGLIDGSVAPTSGRVKHGKTVKVVALSQRLDELEEVGDDPVRDLSGGQKRRLQLLMILLEQPNVLILDEPSSREEHSVVTPRFYRCHGGLPRRPRQDTRGACAVRGRQAGLTLAGGVR